MKTRYRILITAALAAGFLAAMATPASAQTPWGKALSLDGGDGQVTLPVQAWFGGDFTAEA
jgi:hypothetical protein